MTSYLLSDWCPGFADAAVILSPLVFSAAVRECPAICALVDRFRRAAVTSYLLSDWCPGFANAAVISSSQ